MKVWNAVVRKVLVYSKQWMVFRRSWIIQMDLK